MAPFSYNVIVEDFLMPIRLVGEAVHEDEHGNFAELQHGRSGALADAVSADAKERLPFGPVSRSLWKVPQRQVDARIGVFLGQVSDCLHWPGDESRGPHDFSLR